MAVRERPALTAIKDRGRRVHGFWQRITGGFELEQLWGQFLSEARASYGLFSHEVDWDKIESTHNPWFKPFRIIWAFFLAMLMKLTPARRVLLLLAIVLILVQGQIHFSKDVTFDLTWIGIALLFIILALELADRVTMKRDLEIAREIQQWLVPEKPPEVSGVDIAFASLPQNTVAGDSYDAFLRPANGNGESSLVIAVADVAGKSIPAALLMATFQASLRTLSGTSSTLQENVHGLDRYARAHNLEGRRFTTAFLAELDPASGALQYVNAGHNSPIVLRAKGGCERLEIGGPPLGLPLFRGAEPRYECGSIQLLSGDLLFIFTDGMIDAVNEDGEEFGEQQLAKLLSGCPPMPAAALRDRIIRELNTFVGDAHQQDDITCLILRITERAAPPPDAASTQN
jgi:sigma-B regulation protein RsbU (phosphoserine phosphatase)